MMAALRVERADGGSGKGRFGKTNAGERMGLVCGRARLVGGMSVWAFTLHLPRPRYEACAPAYTQLHGHIRQARLATAPPRDPRSPIARGRGIRNRGPGAHFPSPLAGGKSDRGPIVKWALNGSQAKIALRPGETHICSLQKSALIRVAAGAGERERTKNASAVRRPWSQGAPRQGVCTGGARAGRMLWAK